MLLGLSFLFLLPVKWEEVKYFAHSEYGKSCGEDGGD
jgi:hypothetical protein